MLCRRPGARGGQGGAYLTRDHGYYGTVSPVARDAADAPGAGRHACPRLDEETALGPGDLVCPGLSHP